MRDHNIVYSIIWFVVHFMVNKKIERQWKVMFFVVADEEFDKSHWWKIVLVRCWKWGVATKKYSMIVCKMWSMKKNTAKVYIDVKKISN